MRDKIEESAIKSFRSLLERQGFIDISIRRGRELGKFVCTAYDPFECKVFSREYDIPELQCITRANRIFWEYIR